MAQVKFMQYGCGKMSKYTIRYAVEKGYKLVGAYDINKDIFGTDAGDIAEIKKLGVKVEDAKNFKAGLLKKKPDVVIVTTRSLIGELEDVLTIFSLVHKLMTSWTYYLKTHRIAPKPLQ